MKRLISVILSLFFLIFLFCNSLYADSHSKVKLAEAEAYLLHHLELFKGISKEKLDFALDKTPTRLECLVMLIRLMGEEKEALSYKGSPSPFRDVPKWGKLYVDFAYNKGYTKGVSKDKFQPDSLAGSNDYETFVLRALGYTDSGENPDFSYEKAYRFASEKRIHFDEFNESVFTREEAVLITDAALNVEMKEGRGMSLIQKLYDKGVISTYQIYSVGSEPYSEGKGPKDCDLKVVSTVDELVKAIDDNTVVILKEGEYDIGKYVKSFGNKTKISDKVEIGRNEYGEISGLRILIKNVKNFHLIGNKKEMPKLTSNIIGASVLSFESCKDCSISWISIGNPSDNTGFEEIINIRECKNFALSNSEIFDSSYNGLSSQNTDNLLIFSCKINNCPHCGLSLGAVENGLVLMNMFKNVSLPVEYYQCPAPPVMVGNENL